MGGIELVRGTKRPSHPRPRGCIVMQRQTTNNLLRKASGPWKQRAAVERVLARDVRLGVRPKEAIERNSTCQ